MKLPKGGSRDRDQPIFFGDGLAQVAFGADAAHPPRLVIPLDDQSEVVCAAEVAPRCSAGSTGVSESYRPVGERELLLLSGTDGATVPALRYRVELTRWGSPIDDANGSRREEACGEVTEWIWAAQPAGATLLWAPTVEWRKGGEGGCRSRVVTKVEAGHICFEADPKSGPRPGCAGADLPSGCYAVGGGKLVRAEAGAAAPDTTAAHPWRDTSSTPLISTAAVRAAIASVEPAVVRCLANGQQLAVRLTFDGSGSAEAGKMESTPALGPAAESCVRSALRAIAHAPARGTVRTTARFGQAKP